MTLVGEESSLAVGDGLRLVMAHRRRDIGVQFALPEMHLYGNVFQTKSPWAGEENPF
jgi:hypothetical protein